MYKYKMDVCFLNVHVIVTTINHQSIRNGNARHTVSHWIWSKQIKFNQARYCRHTPCLSTYIFISSPIIIIIKSVRRSMHIHWTFYVLEKCLEINKNYLYLMRFQRKKRSIRIFWMCVCVCLHLYRYVARFKE